jgi:hypothetical protein
VVVVANQFKFLGARKLNESRGRIMILIPYPGERRMYLSAFLKEGNQIFCLMRDKTSKTDRKPTELVEPSLTT